MKNAWIKINFAVALLAAGLTAHADNVDYGALGTFNQADPMSTGGITVTGSGLISVVNSRGMGIAGGSTAGSDPIISGTEFARFDFDGGPATGIAFQSFSAIRFGGGSANVGI